jgi:hypothetical protein
MANLIHGAGRMTGRLACKQTLLYAVDLARDSYSIRSVGFDGKAGTEDDLLPIDEFGQLLGAHIDLHIQPNFADSSRCSH